MLTEEEARAFDEFLSEGSEVFQRLGDAAQPGDAAVLSSLVEGSMTASASVGVKAISLKAILSAIGVTSVVGTVAVVGAMRLGGAGELEPTQDQAIVAEAQPPRNQQPQPEAMPPEEEREEGEAEVPVAHEVQADLDATDLEASEAEQPPTTRVNRPKKASLSAAELLVEANRARRSGKRRRARSLYAQLESEYPDSHEAAVARPARGELELASGRPKRALGHFSAYLRDSPKGNMAEESLHGKARALDELGRDDDAVAAWKELLRRFPSSVHARAAKDRLAKQ